MTTCEQMYCDFEATLQEEIDCDDMPEPVYDYSDPNHKPPFKYVVRAYSYENKLI